MTRNNSGSGETRRNNGGVKLNQEKKLTEISRNTKVKAECVWRESKKMKRNNCEKEMKLQR